MCIETWGDSVDQSANPTYSKDYSALKVIQRLSKFNPANGFQPQPPDELVKLHTIAVHTFGFMTFFHNLPVPRNEPRIRGDSKLGHLKTHFTLFKMGPPR